eukprot:TRINITY_DN3681_c0_g1_i1.p1 TRINITY_DN3681_c0_g1~~TRINITY_DN3681_c0_g1_i1.p1  ORF type:complete len:336 (+),score=108.28 TRINITY_DN3681_c0_g1_i1:100-1107(+)
MSVLRIRGGTALDSAGLPYMEDVCTFLPDGPLESVLGGVFDGHGTDVFALHACENVPKFVYEDSSFAEGDVLTALKRSFLKEDDATLPITGDGREGGCTATVVIIRGGKAFVANVGDSRAILVQSEGCQRLTVDHNPSMPEEKQRVMDAGGMIFGGRVQGIINITRSIADHMFKFPYNRVVCEGDEKINADFLSADPFLKDLELDSKDQEAIVIASDGVWGNLTDARVATMVLEKKKEGATAEECAKHVVECARKNIRKQTRDNLSCVVMYLDWEGDESGESDVVEQPSAPSVSPEGDERKEEIKEVVNDDEGEKEVENEVENEVLESVEGEKDV